MIDDQVVARLAERHAAAVEHHRAGRSDTAIPLLEQILLGCRSVLGDRHPDTLTVAGNLAVVYLGTGHTDEAIALLDEVRDGRERIFGDDDPRTLSALDCLAAAHRLVGHAGEAMRLGETVALARERVLGPTHVDTLTSQLGVALAYAEAQALPQAVAVLGATLQVACAAHGPLHRHIIEIRASLACCHAVSGHLAQAGEEYDRAILESTALLGPDDATTAALRSERDELDALEAAAPAASD